MEKSEWVCFNSLDFPLIFSREPLGHLRCAAFFARRRDRKGAGGKGSEGEEKRLGRGIQELMMAGDLRVVVALEMELYLYKSSYQYAPMSRLY